MNIILPDYFDDLKELGGQLRGSVYAALCQAANTVYNASFDPANVLEWRFVNNYKSLFDDTAGREDNLEPNSPFDGMTYRKLNLRSAVKQLLLQLKITNDPAVCLTVHQSALIGGFLKSEYARWRPCGARVTDTPKKSNGWKTSWELGTDAPGEHGFFYVTQKSADMQSANGSTIVIQEEAPEFDWQDGKITPLIACVHIKGL